MAAEGDRRAVLEAIAFGADPTIRPGERLRALELIDELDRREPPWTPTRALDIEVTELQLELDATVAAVFVVGPEDDRWQEWPETLAVLRREVERRVAERLREAHESGPEAQVVALHAVSENDKEAIGPIQ